MKCFELRMLYSSYFAISQLGEPCRSTLYEIVIFSTYLPCGINDLSSKFLALVLYDFAESIFNSGIIAFYKVTINELDSQGRFAWSTISRDGVVE
jgi:hypothetical protein